MPMILWQDLPNATLKDKVVRTLAQVANTIAEAIATPIREGLHNLHDWTFGRWTEEADQVFGPTLDWLRNLEGAPPELRAFIDRLKQRRSPIAIAPLLAIISMVLGPLLMYFVPILMRRLQMQVSRAVRPARAAVAQVTAARSTERMTLAEYLDDMADMGFTERRAEWLLDIAYSWPTVTMLQDLVNRNEIREDTAVDYLIRQGYQRFEAVKMLNLRLEIPPITDLIRFAVREAYTPALAERLGLYEDFPELMMPDATKRGLSRDYALKYWAAHWDLPSVTQVFAMLHRRIKNPDGTTFEAPDMAEFLRVADYSPRWRQMLIDIAYRPFTRVDVRRMYSLGVLKDKETYEAYLDLGYSPEKAKAMLDFTKRYVRQETKDLTRADIEDGYRKHLLEPKDAHDSLMEMGYDEDEADFILARVDFKREQEQQDDRRSRIKSRYTYGLIDVAEATRLLSETGLPLEEINELLAIWTEIREAKIERPSLSKLEELYRHRVIEGPDLAQEIRHLGYEEKYVQWFMDNIEAEIREAEEKRTAEELRRRRAELRFPTKADYLVWLNAGIINQDQFRTGLRDQGYTDEAIDRYLRQVGITVVVPFYRTEEGKVRLATLKLQVREALITLAQFVVGLLALEVPPSLADALAEYEEVRLTPPPS